MDTEFIEKELEKIKAEAPTVDGVTVEAAVKAMVRLKIYKSDNKNLVACFQFPEKYPNDTIIVELKSKVLAQRLLEGLTKVCDKEAKGLIGQRQIIAVTKFIRKFLDDTPLCVCSEEINVIKKDLVHEGDEVKLKQKTSQVVVKLREGNYLLTAKLTVPDDYPLSKLGIEITDQNFPDVVKANYTGQAVEIARRCVQPPLKRKPKDPPFEPKPSLRPVVQYLATEIVHKLPHAVCPLCKQKAFPEDPTKVDNNPSSPGFVERVYCSHLFHHGCLDKYLKTPPFINGKKCPDCGNRIYHDKWKTSAEVLENRWAHKQARDRELSEVVDFLG